MTVGRTAERRAADECIRALGCGLIGCCGLVAQRLVGLAGGVQRISQCALVVIVIQRTGIGGQRAVLGNLVVLDVLDHGRECRITQRAFGIGLDHSIGFPDQGIDAQIVQ